MSEQAGIPSREPNDGGERRAEVQGQGPREPDSTPARREPPAKPEPTRPEPTRREPAPAKPEQRVTRAGAVWASVVAGLAVFVLLIVFFIQNQDQVRVRFLGLDGNVPLALALLIAAVGGGIIVAIAGGVRILQLRVTARRNRRTSGN